MELHRFTIGVLLHKRMWSLSSLVGLLSQKLLDSEYDGKILSDSVFPLINQRVGLAEEKIVSLTSKNHEYFLEIRSDQVIFKMAAEGEKASINIDKAIALFTHVWKIYEKQINPCAVRRLGLVAEYRNIVPENFSVSEFLVNKLTRLPEPSDSSRFKLSYNDRTVPKGITSFDPNLDAFENTIYDFYSSDLDETPCPSKFNANVDFQRFFNPAEKDLLKELKNLRKCFKEKKSKLLTMVKQLGLDDL